MKYVFEKDISMPVCAIKNDIYFNFLSGEVLKTEQERFIKQKIINKTAKILECDLKIYRVIDKETNKTISFNYQINGTPNYLETGIGTYKYPFNERIRQFIKDKLKTGEYIQELMWGDEDE